MSVKIVFKEENEEIFWDFWQKYLARINVSSRYLRITLEQNIKFSQAKSLLYRDKSFVYVVNNEPMACVFLPIEKRGDYLMISHDINDGYVDAPLFKNNLIEKQIFSLIDEIARENNVGKIMFSIDPLENSQINYLQKYNYFDTTILNYIIDLTFNDLFSACRRNHRRNIKFILNNNDFSVFFMDKNNSLYEIHEEYRKLHHKCSGRVTRPKETFDQQFKKLQQGFAVLVGLRYKDKNIAFHYFSYYKERAIADSAADDPDYDKLPLYHILVYKGMEYLKENGVKFIDMGQPSAPSSQFGYYFSDKQLNISLFKSGFGGYYANWFKGIKYFSKELFKQDAEEFLSKYSYGQ